MKGLRKKFREILDINNWDVFTFGMLERDGGLSKKYLYRCLKEFIQEGEIVILQSDVYCRAGFSDPYLISNFLVPDGTIGYLSALYKHGFTDYSPDMIYVQTLKKKRETTILATKYKFIQIKPEKAGGIEMTGQDTHAFRITDREKTLVDCFDLPQYACEFFDLVKIFTRNHFDQHKLISYCNLINNNAVIKRLGYIAEVFKLPYEKFINYAQMRTSHTLCQLDPYGGAKVSNNPVSRWRIYININMIELFTHVRHG